MNNNRLNKILTPLALAGSVVFLTACGGDNSSSLPENQSPTISIAELDEIYEGDTITLDASASQDSDGSISSFSWLQTAGTVVIIENADTAIPTFSFPLLSDDEVMTFNLTVIDNQGAQSTWSQEITVTTKTFINTVDADDAVQKNDTIETASVIVEGNPTVKSIYPANDNDFLQVNLSADIDYEFFANKLCPTCDVHLYLYKADGIELGFSDDYIDYDSRILFTPSESGIYFMEIRAYDEVFGVAKYTTGFHPFVDADVDTFSSYYDCDDTDHEIFPWAPEIRGDGIDQNCSGFDYLIENIADSFEYDDDIENAVTMVEAIIEIGELQFQSKMQANMRTLHMVTDQDFFKIEISPYSALYLQTIYDGDPVVAELLDEQEQPLFEDINFETDVDDFDDEEFVANVSDTVQTIYVKYTTAAIDGATYIPTYVSVGADLDRDGFYSQNWDESRDCDDANAEINPGAEEIEGDSIDSNCDGLDNQ